MLLSSQVLALSNSKQHLQPEPSDTHGARRRLTQLPRVPMLLLATSCYQDEKEVRLKLKEKETKKKQADDELSERQKKEKSTTEFREFKKEYDSYISEICTRPSAFRLRT